MFICVSLNPAVDKRLAVERLSPGEIHRVRSVRAHAGGKSAHVAMALRALGERPQWIGPLGGATGSEVAAQLRSLGIDVHAVPVIAATRTNVEILEDEGRVTELLEPGVPCSQGELTRLEELCGELFRAGGSKGVVIFSGSLPKGTRADLYSRLISLARSFGCRTVLDTSGEPLKLALSANPELVKPNRHEAVMLLGMSITNNAEAKLAMGKILELGARRVALSLGVDGMMYWCGLGEPIYYAPGADLKVRSAVGCGDAAVAGFAQSLSSRATDEESVRLAVACAMANCVAESPGALRSEDIARFAPEVRVEAQL